MMLWKKSVGESKVHCFRIMVHAGWKTVLQPQKVI